MDSAHLQLSVHKTYHTSQKQRKWFSGMVFNSLRGNTIILKTDSGRFLTSVLTLNIHQMSCVLTALTKDVLLISRIWVRILVSGEEAWYQCPDVTTAPVHTVHTVHTPHCPLSSWAHLVMTDSRGRALLASKLVNVSNPYISEACLVSGAHLFEVMCFLGVSPLCGVLLAPLGPEKSHGMGSGPQKLRRVVLCWAIWALLSFVRSRRRLHGKLHLCSRCNSVMMQERTKFIFVRL